MRWAFWGLVLAGTVVARAPALAQLVEITPFAGYRISSDLDDGRYDTEQQVTVVNIGVDDSGEFGLIVDVAPFNNKGFQLEATYSHQKTKLQAVNAGSGDRVDEADFFIDYFQVGLLVQKPEKPIQPFASFGFGLVALSPEGDAANETRTAASIGVGVKAWANPNFALRIQGILRSTYIPSSDEFFRDDDGNFYVLPNAVYFIQGSLDLGLTVAF